MKRERQIVFDSVYRVREGMDPHRHLPFARHDMRIPVQDFYALLRLFPDLNNFHQDGAREAAWVRFRESPLSAPYRVGKVVRGVVRNGMIIK